MVKKNRLLTRILSFTNLCGVLKITVIKDQLESVKSITVSSTNCATSGAFTVDTNNDAVVAVLTAPSNTANTVTVTYTTAVTTDATGKVFYVAIPAQTYKNLSIAVSDGTTTKVMTTKTDQDIVVARNTVYPIDFVSSLITTGIARRTSNINVKWIQLWENGPKFAEYNVGAKYNNAEDYGGYYCWGKTTDKDTQGTYNTGTGALIYTDDTATKLWGNNWRMPTSDELGTKTGDAYTGGLLGQCDCQLTTQNNIKGLLCKGKGAYASNSVFLPATGLYYKDSGVSDQGNLAYYWSSTPYDDDKAYRLYFGSIPYDQIIVSNSSRYFGYSVRAVLAK